MSEDISGVSVHCEPCLEDKTEETAVNYCNECDEYLCEPCTLSHRKSKPTKSHTPITVSEKRLADRKLCEPCNEDGKDEEALNYCEECEEFLCDACTTVHKKGKATKHHTPIANNEIKEKSVSKQSDEVSEKCEPCLSGDQVSSAINYCEECKEFLCNACTNSHRKSKLTKSHEPIPVTALPKVEEHKLHPNETFEQCEPCKNTGTIIEAKQYCSRCDEKLCRDCGFFHGKQKVTKTHELTEIPDNTSAIKSQGYTINCVLCENSQSASFHCTICKENMCRTCTDRHKRQKLTSNHDIIDVEESLIFCNVCEDDGKRVIAMKYCGECEHMLCETCCQKHSRNKVLKAHALVDALEVEKYITFCNPCKTAEGRESEATVFCKECMDFMCEICQRRHGSSKLLKEHCLVSPSEGRSLLDAKMILCEPCGSQSMKYEATNYCNDCKELLCKSCTKFHQSQSATKLHRLSTADECHKEDPKKPEESQSSNPRQKDDNLGGDPKAKETPGKPVVSSAVGADYVTLSWDRPNKFGKDDYFQVAWKDVDKHRKWKIYNEEFTTASAKLIDMKSNTEFIFRVRCVYENGEGPYSPESDAITTTSSPAARVVQFSTQVAKSQPSKYALPVTEQRNARNLQAKCRKFELGSLPFGKCEERTIMLIGATGTGKSTLADGLVNYILGVNWDDPFRFTIIDLEDEEKQRESNQALSQTEWITCYAINPEQGSRLDFRINIIDTPGFGDTRGLKRDQEIVEQIRQLFSEKGPKGVSSLDAVCFLIKSPDARLTAVQSYIFQQIMSMFGKDIEDNICSLITFADGVDPPVIAALKESGLPFGEKFMFNNSGLFAKNVDLNKGSLSLMFWEMGMNSFKEFFYHLGSISPKSLQLTKDVLDERFRLEATVKNLQPQLDAGLLKVNQMKQEIDIIEKNKSLIKDNANFEYEVEETQQKKTELPAGQHVTNCVHCHFTCHERCGIPNDDEKEQCVAMCDGYCYVCPNKCFWDKHHNTPYVFSYVQVKVKKLYGDMQKKYQEASGKLLSQEQVVEKMLEELYFMVDDIEYLMTIIKECNERLAAIALRPNPLSMTDHIDLMVENEKLLRKDGFLERITTLNEFRKRAQIMNDAEAFHKDARSTMNAAKRKKNDKSGQKTYFARIGCWFKKFGQ